MMKASTGVRTREASFTTGTAGRTGFFKDHHDAVFASKPDDHLAPLLIQSRMASTSAAVRAPLPGGICNSPWRRTA